MKHKLLSLLLTLALVLSLFPAALAADGDTVTFSIETRTIDGGCLLEPTQVALEPGDTVYTLLHRVAAEHELEVENPTGSYVTKIGSFGSYQDSDYGTESGWMAAVNSDFSAWPLPDPQPGDTVRFCYTYKTYGNDIALMDLIDSLSAAATAAEEKLSENDGNPFSEEPGYLEDENSKFNRLSLCYADAFTKLEEIGSYDTPKDYLDNVNIWGAGSETELVSALTARLNTAMSGQSYIPATGASILFDGAALPGACYVGDVFQLSAQLIPEDATLQSRQWKVVEATGGAQVDDWGQLTLTAPGMVVVQLWHPDGSNGVLKTQMITISEKPALTPDGVLSSIAAGYAAKGADWWGSAQATWWAAAAMGAYGAAYPDGAKLDAQSLQNYVNYVVAEVAAAPDKVGTLLGAVNGLAALGYDPQQLVTANHAQLNALQALAGISVEEASKGWFITLAPYDLAALNQADVDAEPLKADLTAYMLENLESNKSYVDSYAMVLQGLSYSYADEAVKQAVDSALADLSARQGANGSFGNSNSDAMVILALCNLGRDPATDPAFVKDGKSLLDGLMTYALPDGSGFDYSANSTYNEMSTSQGFLALTAALQAAKTGLPVFPLDFTALTKIPAAATSGGGVTPPQPDSPTNISVTFTLKSNTETWISGVTVTVPDDATVYHVTKKALAEAGYTATGLETGYISAITTPDGLTLAELEHGVNSGWLYKVGDTLPSAGFFNYPVHNGDRVLWYYADDWTEDPDAGQVVHSGSYTPAAPKVTQGEDGRYTVTVPKNKTATVTLPVAAPTPGLVAVLVSADGTRTVLTRSIPTADGLQVTLDATATLEVLDLSRSFADAGQPWYADSLAFVSARGLFLGTGGDGFSPDAPMTAGSLEVVLERLGGVETRILTQADETEPLTRRALVARLYGLTEHATETDPVDWAVQTGLLLGDGSSLDPDGVATRAMAAVVLTRYLCL